MEGVCGYDRFYAKVMHTEYDASQYRVPETSSAVPYYNWDHPNLAPATRAYDKSLWLSQNENIHYPYRNSKLLKEEFAKGKGHYFVNFITVVLLQIRTTRMHVLFHSTLCGSGHRAEWS